LSKLFGTDGVRGIANTELTNKLAYELGRVGGHQLTNGKKRPVIIVGKDTRISCDMLESAITAGFCSVGIDVMQVGVIPTPGVACLVREMKADAGVMISASHNPYEYNGIKFFDKNGYKLADEIEEIIEQKILSDEPIGPEITGHDVGRILPYVTGQDAYLTCLKKTISKDFSGLKVALDCANGAAFELAPRLLADLGAKVFVSYNQPNGININVDCGSTHPKAIIQLVKDTNADLGLAFDGDADRLIAVDSSGQIVDGDHIMAICGSFMKEQGKLSHDTIVGTVMSNMGLDLCLKEKNIQFIKTQVGDRYVLEEMKTKGYKLGGEQSGHIIFLDHNTTGDGLLTSLQLMEAVVSQGKPLKDLSCMMTTMPQVLVNAKVANENKHRYIEDEVIRESINQLELEFEGKGRILIRPSGTEPLVRVMIEGEREEVISQKAIELSQLIESRLG